MANFDWAEELKEHILLLKVMGLWPLEIKISGTNVSVVYTFVFLIIFIAGHNCSQIINIFFVYSDIDKLISMIFLTSTNILAYFKAVVFVKKINVLQTIFKILREKQYLPDLGQLKRIQSSLTFNKKALRFYASLGCCNLILWTATPIVTGNSKTWTLPFIAWYPFDYKKRINFELTYIYQTVAIWWITLGNVAMDSMFFGILMILSVQCKILCDNLSRLNDNYRTNLIRCIIHYESILKYDFFEKFASNYS